MITIGFANCIYWAIVASTLVHQNVDGDNGIFALFALCFNAESQAGATYSKIKLTSLKMSNGFSSTVYIWQQFDNNIATPDAFIVILSRCALKFRF